MTPRQKTKQLLLLLFIFLITEINISGEEITGQINAIRKEHATGQLEEDPLLTETAAAYARELYNRGRLSHQGQGGETALERYRARGGTAMAIGEIIGSGSDIPKIINAWLESETHRQVLLSPRWSHMGSGILSQEGVNVVVILFSEIQSRISYHLQEGSLILTGVFMSLDAAAPFLEKIGEPPYPGEWEALSRSFRFTIPPPLPLHLRLGYFTTEGHKVVTDILYPRS